jgi:hypothetical protein
VLIIGYPNATKDTKYNPLPVNVLVTGNTHGRAGWKPALPGGDQLDAAFGGSIPPVIHDGNGRDIVINDGVPVLSLGLTRAAQPFSEAKPAVVDLTAGGTRKPSLPAIVLPEAMEAAVRK